MAALGVDYVAFCPGAPERYNYAASAPDGLAAALGRGEVPDFLERIALDGTDLAFTGHGTEFDVSTPARCGVSLSGGGANPTGLPDRTGREMTIDDEVADGGQLAAIAGGTASLRSCGRAVSRPARRRAQDKGTLDPKPLPPLAKPNDPKTPAKELFGRQAAAGEAPRRTPSASTPRAALPEPQALPVNGKTWQVMRLSRNRNWGHPTWCSFSNGCRQGAKTGWRGLLVGDMSQPRGGPMLTGHASHQVGLDADIWLTPMPDTRADAAPSARRCPRP